MNASIRKYIRWCILPLLMGGLVMVGPVHGQHSLLYDIAANGDLNLLSNGGFEEETPAYWTATGAGATWTTAASRTPNYSLQLSGAGEAAWTQEEAVLNWVPSIKGNQELIVGGWVRTEGVNTNPTSDAEKFQLVFEFMDAQGQDLLGGPVVIDLPQASASTDGWVQIDNTAIGALTLPADAPSAKITFRKGTNATGTAYLDDVFLQKANESDPWPGGWFNPNMDAGDTWYYWWNNFDLGEEGWPEEQPFIETVTDETAHTGTYSLKMVENVIDPSLEGVAITERVPVTPGEPVLVSFWVKSEGVTYPDSTGISDYNIGLTALWYSSLESGAAGYNEIGGEDIRLNGEYNPNVIPLYPRQAETDWKQYAFVLYPREGAAGLEVRLRYWHKFEGTTYWDDVFITSLGGDRLIVTDIEDGNASDDEVPTSFQLHQNYPNPFNPTTTISFDLPATDQVSLEVYNLLGQRVATLVNNQLLSAGTHVVTFDARNMSSGVYVYVLRSSQRTETRSMLLLK